MADYTRCVMPPPSFSADDYSDEAAPAKQDKKSAAAEADYDYGKIMNKLLGIAVKI